MSNDEEVVVNNDFPRMMYRAWQDGDIAQELEGGKLGVCTVEDEEDLEGALDEGWFKTTTEAYDGVSGDDEKPTREEALARAEELEIEVPKGTRVSTILQWIEEAEEELEDEE